MRTKEQKKAEDIDNADSNLKKRDQPVKQNKKDNPRVDTVTPGNDNGKPGKPETGNKSAGPKGENL